MNIRKSLPFVLIIGFVIYFWQKNRIETDPKGEHVKIAKPRKVNIKVESPKTVVTFPASTVSLAKPEEVIEGTAKTPPSEFKKNAPRPLILPFIMDEGVAVVHGDIVIGTPVGNGENIENGVALVPKIKLWKSSTIAYHIQPNVPNQDRIMRAIAMFSDTNIKFVPYTNQEDVMVFENAQSLCKSYVGSIGGKQPVWISPSCGPKEIAHEILHALGFVHEQNRTDRDYFIQVNPEAIEEKHLSNFDKLPPEYMTVTGLANFDFESIMIYTPTMFAKGGHITMQVKTGDRQIAPGDQLSTSDRERVNRAYNF